MTENERFSLEHLATQALVDASDSNSRNKMFQYLTLILGEDYLIDFYLTDGLKPPTCIFFKNWWSLFLWFENWIFWAVEWGRFFVPRTTKQFRWPSTVEFWRSNTSNTQKQLKPWSQKQKCFLQPLNKIIWIHQRKELQYIIIYMKIHERCSSIDRFIDLFLFTQEGEN